MKPILFNTEMVRAILDGRKTVTRRVVRKKYSNTDLTMFTNKYGTRLIEQQNDAPEPVEFIDEDGVKHTRHSLVACMDCKPPYRSGDILYVRETWKYLGTDMESNPCFAYKANSPHLQNNMYIKWRPSIHMPREAARIFLRVNNVRTERLQDITEGGAKAEGAKEKRDFIRIWNNTVPDKDNQQLVWSANPWVWVIEFERTVRHDEK